jgi:CMP-N-acetylneuraminic acid synthetase
MYKDRKISALIPARGGSKRIPRKNIKLLKGKPLIVYTIYAALKSRYIDAVYVSTEDSEIKKISLSAGAKVLDRPSKLATDTAKSIDVTKHFVNEIDPEVIVLLQPTSPLRNASHIDKAIEIFMDSGADTVFSVCRRHIGPQWILEKEDGKLKFKFKNELNVTRTQDEKETYEFNGAIYIYDKKTVLESDKFVMGKKIYPYIMGKAESIDIDEPEDWELAERLL